MRRKKLSINEEDKQESAEELADATDETPTDTTAPELSAKTEELTEWDDAPESHGTAAPKVLPDDEDDTISSKLVYEGTDEAERERRMAAADPDFEP
ncbi:hypothetical protein CfE428DRAFT_0461 [Chthoniobacter flavus Ellin428]|uniref:Uncharacterized protein n=1 Tax=Chthoniobacter flavus Ellin428 TaxID=497964 RepID=B4CUU8_9BACT|nr:hypothetical protein [Chthoniobacter flavus]EDY22336.1 hypothetical protein CfE428DRAFT_0461 [Chthoniobacter flavus Ellin428]TCO94650.1 hypothetical protein EV701_102117 [Chthoniobacter flavus]